MSRVSLFLSLMVVGSLLVGGARRVGAQWLTQTNQLKAGWNAVYLHVDPSHTTLDAMIGADGANPIQEVWLWRPTPGTAQFVTSPQIPSASPEQWIGWTRASAGVPPLQRLGGNVACLVRVDPAIANYSWKVLGRPVPPRYEWTSSGLNFIGFPSATPVPPSFDALLSRQPELLQSAEIYRYPGGEMGPGNPVRVSAFRTTPVNRGEAFWVRSGQGFNRYFAPFEMDLQSSGGIEFGDTVGQNRIRLRNLTSAPLTVNLELLSSETPPVGQPAILGLPPVLLRGALVASNLTYAHTLLNDGPETFTLAPKGQPDSEREVVLGLDRSQLAGPPGALHAAILRLTDSTGLSRVDVPVSATVPSRAGLWVGEATVQEVRHYLRGYEKDAEGATTLDAQGRYKVISVNESLGSTARPFRLRLILHIDEASGTARLLQRAYYGLGGAGQRMVATREELLSSQHLAHARRIAAVHLPWSAANTPWTGDGVIQPGGTLTVTVPLAYDHQASNPFLHTYHPDHDNLTAEFDQPLPQGAESYGVEREMKLNFGIPAEDFASLTTDGANLLGEYEETLTFRGQGTESRQFSVRGVFSLGRVSDVATLTQ
jgi:hypothetical protein